MNLLQPFIEFGFGEFTFAVEIKEAVFSDIEFVEFFLDASYDLKVYCGLS